MVGSNEHTSSGVRENPMILEVSFDGGCRNNPHGEAASAAIIRTADGRTLRHVGRAIGVGSNNVAEWTALQIGLEAARDLGATDVRAFGDSKLVVEQFRGAFAIREERLKTIALSVSQIVRDFRCVTVTWVPRESNRAADAICTAVLQGTYVPDADLATVADGDTGAVEVSYMCTVRMDANVAREARLRGVTTKELRKRVASQAERRLLLASQIGEFTVTPTRVKG